MQGTFGFDRQPDGAVNQKKQHKQDSSEEPVGIEQGQQCALEDAVGINRQTAENVGKGDPEEQRRQETAHKDADVPKPASAGRGHFLAKFEGHAADDQGEKDEHQGRIERGEHHGIEGGKCCKGDTARGQQPDLVAVPQRTHGIDHHAFVVFGFAQKRIECADSQIEAVGDEENGPQEPPDEKPGRLKRHFNLQNLTLFLNEPSVRSILDGHAFKRLPLPALPQRLYRTPPPALFWHSGPAGRSRRHPAARRPG